MRIARATVSIILTLIVLIAVASLIYMFGAQVGHALWRGIRAITFLIVAFGVIAVLCIVVLFAIPSRGVIVAGVAVGILVTIGFAAFGEYFKYKPIADQIQVMDEAPPNFAERQPFDVASAVSSRTMGSTSGDATGVIKSVPATENFSTSIIRRGMFQGYESIQQLKVAPFGSTRNGDVHFCEFDDDAKLRFDGAVPSNNLTRAIYWKTSPSTKVNLNDAIFTCEGDTPMIYAPLTKMKGFLFPHEVPAGVAIYNGATGDLDIVDEYEGDLPLYPISIAEQQRAALSASGSFSDYLFRRAGWETTEKDSEDPNGTNRAEFSVSSADGTASYYVTPLTPRGASSSIVALGVVQSDTQVKNGELNEFTVYRYPDGQSRQANSAVAASITGEILAGYKSSGLQVFEVAPASDGKWIATIGKDQSILYRAEIGTDGSIILRDSTGAVVGSNASPVKGEDAPTAATTGKAIKDMSNEELDALIQEASKELHERADKSEG